MPEIIDNQSFFNLQSLILGIKTSVFAFLFVWFRATLPRLTYAGLIKFCWLSLLPVAVAFIIYIPCIIMAFADGGLLL